MIVRDARNVSRWSGADAIFAYSQSILAYEKNDSDERPVLGVTRTDGSSVHLHFHKNGRCDKPELFNKMPFEIGAGEPDHGRAKMELPRPETFAGIIP